MKRLKYALTAVMLAVLVLVGAGASRAANPDPSFLYYVPGPDDLLHTMMSNLDKGTALGNDMVGVISVAIGSDGTIIYYDHWEDGYEADIANSVQVTTEIWGDNDPANGMPPGFAVDILLAGNVINLRNDINVLPSRDSGVIYFDSPDKFGSTNPIAASRAGWGKDLGQVLAGALEIADTQQWGTHFMTPVGEDTMLNASDDAWNGVFKYTGFLIQASEDNTFVEVDMDGDFVYEANITINEGVTAYVDGGIMWRAQVQSDKPVQVHMLTGDPADPGGWETRWYSLLPSSSWANSYFIPVGSRNIPASITTETYMFLYNDNATDITINWEDTGGPGSGTLSSKNWGVFWVSYDTGARVWSSGGESFIAIVASNANQDLYGDANNTSSWDWGFSALPESLMTTTVIPSWAPGNGASPPSSTPFSGEVVPLAAIPDGGCPTYILDTFNVAAPGLLVGDVNVGLNLNHTFRGDMDIWLRSPQGTEVLLKSADGSDISDHMDVYYDDGAAVGLTAGNHNPLFPYYENVVFPEGLLSSFNGEDANGNWQLRYCDNWGGDLGVLNRWQLDITGPMNGSPVWISSVAATTVYIDADGNPGTGPFVAPDGTRYDLSAATTPFNIFTYFDNSDNDGTAARIFTTDGTKIAATWGQDSVVSPVGNPYLDMGITLQPFGGCGASETVDFAPGGDVNSNGLIDPGDSIEYDIGIRNTGSIDMLGVVVTGNVPTSTTYIASSTQLNMGAGPAPVADSGVTPFPIDEGGLALGNMLPYATYTVTYQVLVDNPLMGGVTEIINRNTTVTADTCNREVGVLAPVNNVPTAVAFRVAQTSAQSGSAALFFAAAMLLGMLTLLVVRKRQL